MAGVCSPALDGSTAESDVEGVVVFDKLKFAAALPGGSLRPARLLCPAALMSAAECGKLVLTTGSSGSYQIVFSMQSEQAWAVPDIIEVRVTITRTRGAIA